MSIHGSVPCEWIPWGAAFRMFFSDQNYGLATYATQAPALVDSLEEQLANEYIEKDQVVQRVITAVSTAVKKATFQADEKTLQDMIAKITKLFDFKQFHQLYYGLKSVHCNLSAMNAFTQVRRQCNFDLSEFDRYQFPTTDKIQSCLEPCIADSFPMAEVAKRKEISLALGNAFAGCARIEKSVRSTLAWIIEQNGWCQYNQQSSGDKIVQLIVAIEPCLLKSAQKLGEVATTATTIGSTATTSTAKK